MASNLRDGKRWLQDIQSLVDKEKFDKAGNQIALLEARAIYLELENGLEEIFQLKLNEAFKEALNRFGGNEAIMKKYNQASNTISVGDNRFLFEYENEVIEELNLNSNSDVSIYVGTKYEKFTKLFMIKMNKVFKK